VALENKPIIVDTNVIFSALLRGQATFTKLLLTSEHRFFVCEQVLVELFKRKEKIVKASQLTEDDVIQLYSVLLRRINLFKEELISPENRLAAYRLCCDVDETDAPHVALTLELSGLLWTGDRKLKDGLKSKGFDLFFELE
jgi:predicted nucleic acid-binding protein